MRISAKFCFTPASLQTINFAGQDFKLDEPYSQFKFVADTANPLKAVKFKKDDIILENNGVFAWSPESLFNPTLPKVDSQFVVSSQIKYIVADYQAPLAEKDWQAATLDFDLKDSYRENGKYSFMISIPGLRTETGQGNLEIKEIKMELSGRGLLDKIRELIKSR